MTEAARGFEARYDHHLKVEMEFAASGLLHARIEQGEIAHIFASADVGHPTRLAEAGQTVARTAVFARNQLCALMRHGLRVTPATLLATMLDPSHAFSIGDRVALLDGGSVVAQGSRETF